MTLEKRNVFGNVNEYNLLDIWNSNEFKTVRKEIKKAYSI